MLILGLLVGAGKREITFGCRKVKKIEVDLALRPRDGVRSNDSIIAVVLGLYYTFEVD